MAQQMIPRPYQQEANDALHKHICTKQTNPCVVVPTGGGKSPIMAWAIQRWKQQYPAFRCIVLAHRKELVYQNADKMLSIWPDADVGIYAAGLKRRDEKHSITFAAIDSVFRKGVNFKSFDCIIVDEAHRIPHSGDGKYLQFIRDCHSVNPSLRVIGFTATPYRMATGPICHKDHVLNEVCFEANVLDLIRDGFLCKLRSKVGHVLPDLTGVKKTKGDYVQSQLAKAVNIPSLVRDTVAEASKLLQQENRKSTIVFCVDVDHCQAVSDAMNLCGIHTKMVTGKTKDAKRDGISSAFMKGILPAVCNVNVFTEGFDATRIDSIIMLRPTESKGLYAQMVGRGLRLDDSKDDCLILDFAGVIDAHGPVDMIDSGHTVVIVCDECDEAFSKAVRVCPGCGWEVPREKIVAAEHEETERKMHGRRASKASILSTTPENRTVSKVFAARHRKPDGTDSLRVQYMCGTSMVSEWVCLDHDTNNFAGHSAQKWWIERFGGPVPTLDEALESMFLEEHLSRMTQSITTVRDGKFHKIVDHELIEKKG